MGITQCACKRTDLDEEIITHIFNNTLISNTDIKTVYNDFLQCLKIEDDQEKINKSDFDNFMLNVVNPIKMKEAQSEYFYTLIELNSLGTDGIKRIGLMLIFTADGSFSDKINILENHLNTYYGSSEKNLKEFINDLIELQTDCCLVAFKKHMESSWESSMSAIWKKHRKQKLIIKIMHIYNEAQSSHKEESNLTLMNRFLSRIYNNLSGENIRAYLYEEYMLENNKISLN